MNALFLCSMALILLVVFGAICAGGWLYANTMVAWSVTSAVIEANPELAQRIQLNALLKKNALKPGD